MRFALLLTLSLLLLLLVALLPVAQEPLAADLNNAVVLWNNIAELIDRDTDGIQVLSISIPIDVYDLKRLLNSTSSEVFYIVVRTASYDPYVRTPPSLTVSIVSENPLQGLWSGPWLTAQPILEYTVPRSVLEYLVDSASNGKQFKLVIGMPNYNTGNTSADRFVMVKITQVLLAPPEVEPEADNAQPQGKTLASFFNGAYQIAIALALALALFSIVLVVTKR